VLFLTHADSGTMLKKIFGAIQSALVFFSLLYAQDSTDSFIRGVDISFTPEIEHYGGTYYSNGVATDVLDIFKQNGVNYVRLRIWHTPTDGWCGLDSTLAYALRVKERGFKFLLDFHYSDWWADPGKQNKPSAWVNASYTALKDSVYTYTKNVIEAFKNQNTLPDMVQIGNEITAGMLWPDGKISVGGWGQFAELVKQGIQGAKDGAQDSTMKIMIHIDRGGDNSTARWFFDNLKTQGVQFDDIGLSYYPFWHGSLATVQANVNDLATRYGKDVVLVEIAYPWTTSSVNDGMGNIGIDPSTLPKGYAISAQGQKAFIATVSKIMKEVPNNRGKGFFYWEPAYISVPPIGSSWEHLTTFDFSGNATTGIKGFLNFDTMKTVSVTVRVNTASVWDTLKTTGVVQLRGEIIGNGSSLLPDGELVTWDSYSDIHPTNVGGDYWEYTFPMYQSDRLEYKFWTGHSSSKATNLRLGYEGPVTPADSSARNIRMIVAGENDTIIAEQFPNSSGNYVYQFWTPVPHKQDSIGIYFRVNVSGLMSAGLFDPAINSISVRGDSASSKGILSWSADNVMLHQETLSVASGSFWSGAVYFPTTLQKGNILKYKFFVRNSAFGGWESSIGDRFFPFPEQDSTLQWKFFNESNPVTAVHLDNGSVPGKFYLSQNYPNPFNPATTIQYSVPQSAFVTIRVFGLLGKKVATIVSEQKPAGVYLARFDASRLPTSMYFYTMNAGSFTQTKRMILLK
jgi:arabinogalactan endo-1,4-beta-galactosidase